MHTYFTTCIIRTKVIAQKFFFEIISAIDKFLQRIFLGWFFERFFISQLQLLKKVLK